MNKLIFSIFTIILIVFINSRLIGQNIIIKDMKSQTTVTTTIEKQRFVNSTFSQSVDTSKAVSVHRVEEINKNDTIMINYLVIDKKSKMKLSNNNMIFVDKNSTNTKDTTDMSIKKVKPVSKLWTPDSK